MGFCANMGPAPFGTSCQGGFGTCDGAGVCNPNVGTPCFNASNCTGTTTPCCCKLSGGGGTAGGDGGPDMTNGTCRTMKMCTMIAGAYCAP